MTCSGVEPGNIFKGLTVSNANVTSFELFYTTYYNVQNYNCKFIIDAKCRIIRDKS